MIQANELRIGNFVRIMNAEFPLNKERFIRVFNETYSVEPIPLTKKWLFKLGFRKKKNTFMYIKGDWNIFFISDTFINITRYQGVSYQYERQPIYLTDKVKYVHQLQNLYYSLEEKELVIK